MFTKWLKDNYNMSKRDYKSLDKEKRLEYYQEYAATKSEIHKCPDCGADMLSGTDAWVGANSTYVSDLCCALVANPTHPKLLAKTHALIPTAHVCLNCGFMGLYMSKEERSTFVDICCDVDYHE